MYLTVKFNRRNFLSEANSGSDIHGYQTAFKSYDEIQPHSQESWLRSVTNLPSHVVR